MDKQIRALNHKQLQRMVAFLHYRCNGFGSFEVHLIQKQE